MRLFGFLCKWGWIRHKWGRGKVWAYDISATPTFGMEAKRKTCSRCGATRAVKPRKVKP